jgi:alpha(1,3/1,4) fucosyltransferase
MAKTPSVTLFLDPLTQHLEHDRLFDVANSATTGDRILEPYAHLRAWLAERGIATHTGDLLVRGDVAPSELNLYATMGMRIRYRQFAQRPDTVLSAFLVNECPIVEPTLYADLHNAATHFRRMYSFAGDEEMRPFLRGPVAFRPFRFPYPFSAVVQEVWESEDRGFLTIINANKVPRLDTRELYSERLRAIAFFEQKGEIDLYGIGWDGPPFRVGETGVPNVVRRAAYLAERRWDRLRPNGDPLLMAARRAWRGQVASKSDTLCRYTFAICFENMVMQGWVTEKVFDCLVAGTIPVYLGAPDIERWVDPESFIDMRRFSNYEELREYLRSLGPDEITAYREAGRDYLRSNRFRPFTKQAFAEHFGRIVAEDAGVPV